MADSKKPLTASSLLSTTNSLLSTKTPTLSTGSLLQNSSLLSSTTFNTTSSLLSGTNTNKQSSLLSSSSSSSLLTAFSKPLSSSTLLSTSSTTSSSFLSTVKLPNTNNTLLSSFSSNNASLLTTETSLSRKRKADLLEPTVVTKPIIQETFKKSTVTTESTTISLSDENDHKYNAENIQPIQSQSIHLDVDLHCYIPAPKRPRIDPFSSIFTRLENQTKTDDDFNVGIKSIKV